MNGNTVVRNREQEETLIICIGNMKNGNSLSRDYEENEEQKKISNHLNREHKETLILRKGT